MLYSVPLKTLWRNKGRTLILMIGITISISLITSVFISSDRYSNDLIQEAEKIMKGNIKTGKIPKFWDGKTAERIVKIFRK